MDHMIVELGVTGLLSIVASTSPHQRETAASKQAPCDGDIKLTKAYVEFGSFMIFCFR